MLYSEAQSLIRSGDLLAWGHDAWRSYHDLEIQAVRMFTRSEYAHVAVAWNIGERVLVIEAVVPHVRIFPLDRLLPCYWLSGEVRNSWTPEMTMTALLRVGEEYSKLEAIRSFIGKVVPGANALWQCAELACFMRAGMLLKQYDSPTPTSVVKEGLMTGCNLTMILPDPVVDNLN